MSASGARGGGLGGPAPAIVGTAARAVLARGRPCAECARGRPCAVLARGRPCAERARSRPRAERARGWPRAVLAVVGAVMVLALMPRIGAAQDVPALSGRVNDTADMIPADQEAALTQRLAKLEADTGAQIVILTIPSLDGYAIEDYAIKVAETWKIGRGGVDDGVVILVARDDHAMRIEVGYGLEGAITDAQAHRIISDIMTPAFQRGDFGGGLLGAVDALDELIRGEGLPPPSPTVAPQSSSSVLGILAGLTLILAAALPRALAWIVYLGMMPALYVLGGLLTPPLGLPMVAVWAIVFPLFRVLAVASGTGRVRGRPGGCLTPWMGPWGGGFGGPFGPSRGGFGGFGGGFSGGGGRFGGGGASGRW